MTDEGVSRPFLLFLPCFFLNDGVFFKIFLIKILISLAETTIFSVFSASFSVYRGKFDSFRRNILK